MRRRGPPRATTSRSVREVVAAWLVTGPVGHLWAGVADWVAVVARYLRARARGEDPFL